MADSPGMGRHIASVPGLQETGSRRASGGRDRSIAAAWFDLAPEQDLEDPDRRERESLRVQSLAEASDRVSSSDEVRSEEIERLHRYV